MLPRQQLTDSGGLVSDGAHAKERPTTAKAGDSELPTESRKIVVAQPVGDVGTSLKAGPFLTLVVEVTCEHMVKTVFETISFGDCPHNRVSR